MGCFYGGWAKEETQHGDTFLVYLSLLHPCEILALANT